MTRGHIRTGRAFGRPMQEAILRAVDPKIILYVDDIDSAIKSCRNGCRYQSETVGSHGMPDTIEDYFCRAEEKKTSEFRLVIVRGSGPIEFYIHPLSRDGETANFSVNGAFVNKLDNPAGSPRKMGRPLVGSNTKSHRIG